MDQITAFFENRLKAFGPTPQGVDWNSAASQELRFAQLLKVVDASAPFTLLDYGCGHGSLAAYLERLGLPYTYYGYDLSVRMIETAQQACSGLSRASFTSRQEELPVCDFVFASGVFNMRLNISDSDWQAHVLETLQRMNGLARRGLAFNMLTAYSDADRMRPELYYGDPCRYFDFCKRNFSRNVALLHDYEAYDFTILVRK